MPARSKILPFFFQLLQQSQQPRQFTDASIRGEENVTGRRGNLFNDLLRAGIMPSTGAWGLEVERFEMKDVELPEAMQQVMAMQAEAIREKRARIIKAEAEMEASLKLSQAAEQMAGNPVALELRRMQMLSEIGAENNSTTVLMIPADFVAAAKSLGVYLSEHQRKG